MLSVQLAVMKLNVETLSDDIAVDSEVLIYAPGIYSVNMPGYTTVGDFII